MAARQFLGVFNILMSAENANTAYPLGLFCFNMVLAAENGNSTYPLYRFCNEPLLGSKYASRYVAPALLPMNWGSKE